MYNVQELVNTGNIFSESNDIYLRSDCSIHSFILGGNLGNVGPKVAGAVSLSQALCSFHNETIFNISKRFDQSIILFGEENWVMSEPKFRKPRTFLKSCARFITRRFIRPADDGTSWIYTDSTSVLVEAGRALQNRKLHSKETRHNNGSCNTPSNISKKS